MRTTPPAVLPLVGIGLVATAVAWQFLELAVFLVHLGADALPGGDPVDAVSRDLAVDVLPGIAFLVALTVLLRWLVRRWVARQLPEPLADAD